MALVDARCLFPFLEKVCYLRDVAEQRRHSGERRGQYLHGAPGYPHQNAHHDDHDH